LIGSISHSPARVIDKSRGPFDANFLGLKYWAEIFFSKLYRAFLRLGLSKLGYGGLVLGSNHFGILIQLPQKNAYFKSGKKRLKNNKLALMIQSRKTHSSESPVELCNNVLQISL